MKTRSRPELLVALSLELLFLLGLCKAPAQEAALTIEHLSERAPGNGAVLRPKPAGVLRVVTGGLLKTGADEGNDDSYVAASAKLGHLDAVAVGYADLTASGAREMMAAHASIPFVCANVRGQGVSLETHVVRRVGSTRVAFVGVTRVPAHRRDGFRLDGWQLTDPKDALAKVLPEIAASADLIVLLAVMDPIDCAALMKEFPRIRYALVPSAGTQDPRPVPSGGAHLVRSPVGSSLSARLKLQVRSGQWEPVSSALEMVALSAEERDRVRQVYAKHGRALDLESLVSAAAPKPVAEADRAILLPATAANRGARLTIDSMHLLGRYGAVKAPAGMAWLVLRSTWTNIIPMTFVFKRQVPTAYLVPAMADHLYLVVNGRRLARPGAVV